MRLTTLEIDGYSYYHDPDRPELGGDLMHESEVGDTLLANYPGTYTTLEHADSEEEAAALARLWESQEGAD